tara:strand:+ start:440 stop:838 length:399 start_codon:yes stop_codon:yes gene_type:complete
MLYIKLFLTSFATFLILDAIWLGFVAKDFYAKQLSFYLTDNVVWSSALIFYIIFNIGLLVLVILPSIEKNSYSVLIFYAVLYGLVTFATYDLTNLATIKEWPLIVSLVDMAWGMFVAFSSASAAFYANKYLF